MVGGAFEVTCTIDAIAYDANGWDPCGDGYTTGLTLAEFLGGGAQYQTLGYVTSGMAAASSLFQST
jgi:hypothetical protein